MNKFTIIECYSDSPEDWTAESIIDQLEEGETMTSLTIESSNDRSYYLCLGLCHLFVEDTTTLYQPNYKDIDD